MKPDHYHLPNIKDITSFLHKAKVFSILDPTKGHYQIPLNPEDDHKTAIATSFRTYTLNYFCFSLRNTAASFQHLMDSILGHLDFMVVYIDNILVYSKNKKRNISNTSAPSYNASKTRA